MNSLFVLDFDKTLFKKDSMFLYFKYMLGSLNFYMTMLYFATKYPFIKNRKEFLINTMLSKMGYFNENFDHRKHCLFFEEHKHLLDDRFSNILKMSEIGIIDCVVVTASLDIWVSDFLPNHIELISSDYRIVDRNFLLDENNKGCVKVKNIQRRYNLKDYSFVVSFGDSKEDECLSRISVFQKINKYTRVGF